jgi:DNA-binding HxlR family transcriptional regulator
LKDEEPKIVMDNMKCCPVDNTFKIIGKKFTIHILRNMSLKQSHFNEFIDSIEGINPKTLSTRLREMERNGII